MPAKKPTPSMEDIVAAITALHATAPAGEKGLAKHATSIVAAVVLALVLWVGSSVTSLGTTVTRISANVDQVQKSISDLQQGQTVATKSMADLQAASAKTDARADALDADMARTKERVRILEGNAPLQLGVRP